MTTRIALFDFDETLVHGNSVALLYRHILQCNALSWYAIKHLPRLLANPGPIKKKIKSFFYHAALTGYRPAQIYLIGKQESHKLKLIKDTVALIHNLYESDDIATEVWIVTASPQSWIKGLLSGLHLPHDCLIGTLPPVTSEGVYTGEMGIEIEREQKVMAIHSEVKKRGIQPEFILAAGNLPVDQYMMNMADKAYNVKRGRLSVFK